MIASGGVQPQLMLIQPIRRPVLNELVVDLQYPRA